MEKFIYDLINGIGVVLEENDNFITVLFSNGEKIQQRFDPDAFIDDNVVDNIINSKFEEIYNLSSLRKGEEYALAGNVRNYSILGKSISSSVVSNNMNNVYQQTITFTKNNIRAVCDCPVGVRCKHTASVLYKIQDDLKYLLSYDDNNNFDTLYTYTMDLIRSSISDDYEKYYNLYQKIDFNDKKKLGEYIDFLLQQRNTTIRKMILRMVFFNEKAKLYTPGKNYSYVVNDLRKEIDAIKYQLSFSRNIYSYDFDILDIFFWCLSLNDYEILIRFLYLFKINNFKNIFKFLINHYKFSYVDIENYFEYINNYFNPKDFIDLTEEFMNKIDKNYLNDFKKKYPKFFRLTRDEIMSNSPDEALELINNSLSDYEKIMILSSESDYFYNNSKKKFIALLFNLYLETHNKLIINILEKYNDLNIIIMLLQSNINNIDLDYINMDIFNKNFEISISNKKIRIDYKLLLDNELIISAYRINDSIYFTNDNPYIKNTSSNFFKYFIKNIEDLYDFKEELKKNNELLMLTINKEKYDAYNLAIKELENKIDKKILSTNEKIHIKPLIGIVKVLNRYNTSLELRVGTFDKFYIIKSIPDFLNNVENEKNYKYGVKLEFNHTISNFDFVSQQLLDLLLTMFYYAGNLRSIPITNALASKIIDLYKNYSILIEYKDSFGSGIEKEYNVLDDIDDIKLNIDDNMHLNSSINKDNSLKLHNNIYYLEGNNIKKINLGRDDLALVDFGINNNGMDLSIIKDKFSEEVLKRYSDKIDISSNVKNNFKISILRIDARFDLTKDYVLIVKLQLFKDDKEIYDLSSISSVDRVKVSTLLEYLMSLGFTPNRDGINSFELLINDGELVTGFLKMDFKHLKELCNVYLSEDIQNKKLMNISNLSINVKYENSCFEAFMEESEYDKEELYLILKAIRQKKKYVLLSDDKIIDLDNSDASDLYQNISDLGIDINDCYKSVTIPVYKALEAYALSNNINLDDYIKEIHSDIVSFKDKNIELPNINANLRKYQVEGFNFMHILKSHHLSGILADDMGLGKTLEVITLFASDDTPMPSIVICPKTLIFNWISEILKFTNNMKAIPILGSKKERIKIIDDIKSNEKVIYITSYDSLRLDIELYKSKKFNYIIIDEAQYIKNVFAQKSRSVKELDGNYRFALTGTPIENNIGDLWSIFDFLMPGYFPELTKFMARYQNNMDALRKAVSPFILRRRKKDVLNDLPDKIETIISVPMLDSQKRCYDAYKLEAQEALDNGGGVMDLLPLLTRLRQICISPELFTTNFPSDSGKLDMLYDMIKEKINDGHKILIFSSFVEGLKVIQKYLDDNLIMYHMLTGKTDIYNRKKYVDEFNSINDYKVFLISLKAGGTGLNLTSADTVIHLDPWWNLSLENQATDRAYRIGQERTVNVYKLVCENSIEERIIELQNLKRDVIDKVISDDDSSITSFSLDDMRFILR